MVALARLIGLVAGYFVGTIVHEWAHAVVADRLGDKQPRFQRRLTLKPKTHADPVGTIGMPAVFTFLSLIGRPLAMHFGYAKPLPWNPSAFRNRKRDIVMVACAGPAVNLLAALAFGLGARSVHNLFAARALAFAMSVNAFILVINILPIPPLDGSKILGMFLSPRAQFMMLEYQQYLLLVIVVLLLLLPGVPGAMANPVCRAFANGINCPLGNGLL